MGKEKFVISLIGLCLLTACQFDAGEDTSLLHESGNTINVSDRPELYNGEKVTKASNDKQGNFGYVRHQKSGVPGDNSFTHIPGFDREKAADTTSSLIIQLQNVNDVATLVTDEEVLVAYETDSNQRSAIADQVKKTALSVVPRYYHVYISDQTNMIQQIEAFSPQNSTSRDIDEILDNTIQEMLKSPQGRAINNGENANGEGYSEVNEDLDDDIRDRYKKTRFKEYDED